MTEPAFAIGRKRISPHTDLTRCLICQKDLKNKWKLQKLTSQGHNSLTYAVKQRQDDIAFRLVNLIEKENFLEKEPVCHQKCRDTYTNKKTVEQVTFKRQKGTGIKSESDENDHDALTRTRSSIGCTSEDIKNNCFICDKKETKKDLKV